MTVSELIEILKNEDQNMRVYVPSKDDWYPRKEVVRVERSFFSIEDRLNPEKNIKRDVLVIMHE